MKTAMQELIEFMNENKYWPKSELALVEIDDELGRLKAKEREQIEQAWMEGMRDCTRGSKEKPCKYENSSDYFTQTYNTPKP